MTKYTIEEKLIAVKHYFDRDQAQRNIAKSIGVDHSVFRTWILSISEISYRIF